MNNNPILYILLGAPGSGKTEFLKYIVEAYSDKFSIIDKETTRPARDNDSFEINPVKQLSHSCDVIYSLYGSEYGFSSNLIWESFKENKSVFVIINDIRTAKFLARKFGVLAKLIYIHSRIDQEKFGYISINRYKNQKTKDVNITDTEKRLNKIAAIHNHYIENSYLFDYTVLNIDSLGSLHKQIDKIVENKDKSSTNTSSYIKLFIIVGASESGKDDLVCKMVQMDEKRFVSCKKGTTRNIRHKNTEKHNDKEKHKYIEKHELENYDIKYKMQGFDYGIKLDEIWDLLAEDKVVFLVLNDIDSIKKIKEKFGNICYVLYLHSLTNPETFKINLLEKGATNEEVKLRLKVSNDLFHSYIADLEHFDHVLLNTAEEEDLYDQCYNLIEYYCF